MQHIHPSITHSLHIQTHSLHILHIKITKRGVNMFWVNYSFNILNIISDDGLTDVRNTCCIYYCDSLIRHKKSSHGLNGIIDLFPSSGYSTGVLLSYIFYYIHAFVCLWPRADLMISQMHHFIIYNQPSRAQVLWFSTIAHARPQSGARFNQMALLLLFSSLNVLEDDWALKWQGERQKGCQFKWRRTPGEQHRWVVAFIYRCGAMAL